MAIRGFDPSKVQRQHISPKTLVYGTDKPGIDLRMHRFTEILEKSHESPAVFPNARSAIGYLSSGDMFSDHVCVVVNDVADMLKSDTPSKQLYSSFVRALATYDETSTIVMGAAAKTQTVKKLADDIARLGGVVREVEAPMKNDFATWLDEYCKSASLLLSDSAKKKIASASGEDVDAAVTIIKVIGTEIEDLSEEDVRSWLDSEDDATGSDIRTLMENRDVAGIASLRAKFAPNTQGYRTFLVKLRHNLLDIVIATTANGSVDPLFGYKAAQYGNGNSAYYVMREKIGPEFSAYYLSLYREINSQIEDLAKSGTGDMERLLATVAAS